MVSLLRGCQFKTVFAFSFDNTLTFPNWDATCFSSGLKIDKTFTNQSGNTFFVTLFANSFGCERSIFAISGNEVITSEVTKNRCPFAFGLVIALI